MPGEGCVTGLTSIQKPRWLGPVLRPVISAGLPELEKVGSVLRQPHSASATVSIRVMRTTAGVCGWCVGPRLSHLSR